MHVEPHHTLEQLAALIRTDTRATVARRLQAVRLALLGQTAPAITAQVLLSDRQVRTWSARYDRGGLDDLADQPGRGLARQQAAVEQGRLLALGEAGLAGPAAQQVEPLGTRAHRHSQVAGAALAIEHEQGISKAGNKHVRGLIVELARIWLRWQPASALSKWYDRRVGSGSKRAR